MIVDNLIAGLDHEIRGEDELNRFRQSIDNMAMRVAVFADLIANSFLSLGNFAIGAAAEFQKFRLAPQAAEGSSQKARDPLDQVSDFVPTTAYEVGKLADVFARLRLYGIDPASGVLETIGDATVGHLERPIDLGISISAQAADDEVTSTRTKNGETLSKTVQGGSAEIAGFLQGSLGDRFTRATARPSQTSNLTVSNLGEDSIRFLIKAGDAGIFKRLKRWIDIFDFFGPAVDVISNMPWTMEEMEASWKKTAELNNALEPYTPRGILKSIMDDPKRFLFGAAADGGSLRDHLRFDVQGGALGNTNSQGASPPMAEDLATRMENFQRNAAKLEGSAPANAVVKDCCQDNRNQSITVTVNQTVQQATEAPAAVAQATAEAARNAALNAAMERRPSRLEMEPHH